MSALEQEEEQAVQAAAAVLVLIEGASADVAGSLEGLADSSELSRIARVLTSGERAARARALAAPLGRVAIALDEWGLR